MTSIKATTTRDEGEPRGLVSGVRGGKERAHAQVLQDQASLGRFSGKTKKKFYSVGHFFIGKGYMDPWMGWMGWLGEGLNHGTERTGRAFVIPMILRPCFFLFWFSFSAQVLGFPCCEKEEGIRRARCLPILLCGHGGFFSSTGTVLCPFVCYTAL